MSFNFRSIMFLVILLLIVNGHAWSADNILPRPDHVIVVIEENHSFSSIIGNPKALYSNELAARGALFNQSYGLAHPSQPNYIMLFAGSNLGVDNDYVPANLPWSAPNLGAELLARGLTFATYSEGLPEIGFEGPQSDGYVRRHNPCVNWQGARVNAIPRICNLPFSAWPKELNQLPTVAFVIPDMHNDMHDGSIARADAWLKEKLDGYVRWAGTHNSLFILTFDEDDYKENQRILTFFVGPMVQAGKYDQRITHYEILRTIEEFYGLPPSGAAAKVKTIDFCW